MEIGAIDSTITPIYQIDTQRSGVNPFAPAEEAATKNTQKTEEKAKVNSLSSASELIQAFSLTEPANKLKVLSCMNLSQQKSIISLLDPEAKVLGMKFYNQDKILNMLFETSQQDISQVLMGSMPMEKIFEMIPEEFLNKFIMSEELDKDDFMLAFQSYSPEQLVKFMENLTGIPQQGKSAPELLGLLQMLPLEMLQPSLLGIKPDQKIILISQMMKSNKDLFNLFPKGQLLMPLDKVGKEKTLSGFGNLDTNLVGDMLKQLPDELLPLLLTMIDTQTLANTLMNKYPDVIQAAFRAQAQA